MSTTKTTRIRHLGWLAIGIVLGTVGLGSILWAGGWIVTDRTLARREQQAPTDMGDPAESSASSASVQITPAQIQQFGITFGVAEERALVASFRAIGVVTVDETRLFEVVAKFPGYVEHLYADYTGQNVEAGSPLLDVYAPDLVAAQEEILLARDLQATVGSIRLPGVNFKAIDLEASARRRLSLWDISDDQINALLAEGRPSRTLTLNAPISGVVLEKRIVSGAAFGAGQTLFRIADLSEVWIDVEIRETDAGLVQRGSTADVAFTAYPGENFPAVVDFIYPTVDERTRSVRARLAVSNRELRIRPGMYATVEITTPRQRALSVPLDAVVWTGERTLLFIEEEGGRIQPIEADLGATVGDYVVVLAGVEAGQRVVTSAQYLIDAEANIGAIMRSMMSMMGSGDMGGMDMGTDSAGGAMNRDGDTSMQGTRMPGDSSVAPNRQGR